MLRAKVGTTKATWGLMVAALCMLMGCGGSAEALAVQQASGGDPARGRQLTQQYGCSSCHTIPGVPGANALVGPPLNGWAERHYIAGELPNTAENLIRFIQYPQSVRPGGAMPNMNVSAQDALDISAYLYTLRRKQEWNLFGND